MRGGWVVGIVGLAVTACGDRAPKGDMYCDPEKPHAYELEGKPMFGDCDEVRTHEGVRDPKTGKVERIHNYYYCCR